MYPSYLNNLPVTPRLVGHQARGRLLLFEVDYAYLTKEDGGHEYAVKLRQVFAKEQLGPVAGEVMEFLATRLQLHTFCIMRCAL